jgi:putative flippase GtrA
MPEFCKFIIRNHQFIRFLAVGGLNTLFGYSIFALLIYCGLHYTFAAFLATCAGILFNFKTTGKLVFNNTNNNLLIRFASVYGVTYLLNILTIKITNHFLQNIYLSGGIAAVLMAVIAYLLNKHFVFSRKEIL